MSSVTFSTAVGGDGSTVTDDNNATTGLREGGWKTRFVPCFTQQVAVANYIVTKAGEASTSASAASASASAAAASYDSFDDRYLGSKTSDPSVDNDGNALITGALYWNSSSSVMKVWTGSAWVNPNPAAGYLALSGGTMSGNITFNAGQTIAGYLALSGGTMSGNITFNSAQFGTGVGTFLSTPSSANLAAALTDETGTGVNVFNNTPTLVTPVLGTPTSGDLSNCTNAVGYGLKSATTTVSISSATAPSTGQILTATDSTTATWQTPAGGATWVYLSTVNADYVATADIETTFNTTYDEYVIVACNVIGDTSGAFLRCRVKLDGIYQTVAYAYGGTGYYGGASNAQALFSGYNDSSFQIAGMGDGGNGAYSNETNFLMYVTKPVSSSGFKVLHWHGGQCTSLNNRGGGFTAGGYCGNSANDLTGIRFLMSSGGFISGTFRLYGIKNS